MLPADAALHLIASHHIASLLRSPSHRWKDWPLAEPYSAVRDGLMLFFSTQSLGTKDPSLPNPQRLPAQIEKARSIAIQNPHEDADEPFGPTVAARYGKLLAL